jgi:hypothetical protein
VASQTDTPKKAVKSADRANICHSPEPEYKSTHIGISMEAANTVVKSPKIFKTGDSCMQVTSAPRVVLDRLYGAI